jgi:amidophosphoribosyltransferase
MIDPTKIDPAASDPSLGPDDDHFHDECGVFGIYGASEAAAHTALGLHALQHRGQEAAGIVSFDGARFNAHRASGQVGANFSSAKVIADLRGYAAIGHVRYSTAGDGAARNVQPIYADMAFGGLAIAHNGNLTNALMLRQQLVQQGCIFQSTLDTEVITHLIATSKAGALIDRLVDALTKVEGAYSLVALANDTLIGMRDPFGVRPLALGDLGGAPIIASESCAFDIIGATMVRDIEPGELIVINSEGIKSFHPFAKVKRRFCIFEFVYFARPDSLVEGTSVYEARKRIGAELAKESHIDADMVIPVPDSGVPAAIGYAQAARIPFELGIIRNHYVGRTFIEPTEQIRDLGVKLKHNANRANIAGKRVVLVDDSIVRGTTSSKIVAMIRDAGALEVHMRIASPPTTHSCFYGVDTPERSKLLAATHDLESMRHFIKADSLAFVSMDGLYRAMGEPGRNAKKPQFCDACFSGDYPISLTDQGEGKNNRSAQLSLLAELA